MARKIRTKNRKAPVRKPTCPRRARPPVTQESLARLAKLERLVDQLRGQLIHASKDPEASARIEAHLLNQNRFVKATSDGWLTVLIIGTRVPLPSGLKVLLTSTSGGRDFGKVLEGVLINKNFDVTAGNLVGTFRRVGELEVSAATRAGGPVQRDGETYDLDLRLSYTENGAAQNAGPFLAKMDPTNPLPAGTHDLEIPDFPHQQGPNTAPHGTVWFRIGHSGDRYMHPGGISEGCLTCAPSHWEQIYAIVHCARIDNVSVGRLNYRP